MDFLTTTRPSPIARVEGRLAKVMRCHDELILREGA